MTAKQLLLSSTAPDGSDYVTQTNGNGTLTLGGTKLFGNKAKDGSKYITLTDGNGTLT
ncbi:MAG TPA: hypothetical protein VEP90_12935 [Methylomirabilota bacterium]|nr:hypothetical protein [Methylomirabilota bacterium]